MENFFTLIKKFKVAIALLSIMGIGLFLRLYGLGDWLHFELDQARDALLVREALEGGWREAPLLGPRAGGSLLRLGPLFYYLMIFSAWVTGEVEPVRLVWPGILFGLLNLPLFFILFRKIFAGRKDADFWSLTLTFLAGTSAFLVTYDRFAWNPNLMPFFSSLVILFFLKYLESKRKSEKKSFYWAAGVGMAFALISQFHFLAVVALPIILGLTAVAVYLKERYFFNWRFDFKVFSKDVLAFFLAFAVFQMPLWVNEWVSKGSNLGGFFETVADKQGKDKLHNVSEQLIQNIGVYPKAFYISVTGLSLVNLPTLLIKQKPDVICDNYCREGLILSFFFFLLFFALLLINGRKIFLFLKRMKQKPTKVSALEQQHFEFLFLILLWIMVAWWSLYSQSFNLKPRFYLFSVVPIWLFLAFALRFFLTRFKQGFFAALILMVAIGASNFYALLSRFEELRSAGETYRYEYFADDVFPFSEGYPVTVGQEKAIADWMEQKYRADQNRDDESLLMFWAPSFYYRPISYFLDRGDLKGKVNYFSNDPVWRKGKYFAVARTTKPESFFKKGREENFEVLDYEIFGTLAVYELKLTEKGLETAKKKEKKFLSGKKLKDPQREKRKCLQDPKPACRFTWGDVF